MPRFIYKAKKGPTEIVEGEMDAENEDSALGKISALGLIPVKLEPVGGATVRLASASQTVSAPEEIPPIAEAEKAKLRISHRELNVFTRQFSILLKASVPLLRIFQVLQTQSRHPKFRQALAAMHQSIRSGSNLSEVLAQYPRIFSQIFVSMVQAGEVSGTLDKVLMQLSGFAEKEAETRAKVQAALIYPLFLLLMGAVTVFILLTFVMPRMLALFVDLGTELPWVTRVVMRVSRFCQSYWLIITGGIVGIVIWLRSFGLSPSQKKALDGFSVRLPLFGALIEKSELSRFLRSLELLYENGIPLFRAVEVATRTVSNLVIRAELEKVPERLESGQTLARSLEGMTYVSDFVVNMVSVGEESGKLGSAVNETAAFYEQETNQAIKIATSLLEPLMILIVGVVIGFVVIAMLLPVFEIHVLAQ